MFLVICGEQACVKFHDIGWKSKLGDETETRPQYPKLRLLWPDLPPITTSRTSNRHLIRSTRTRVGDLTSIAV
jgi:hypothetical protein